VGGFGSGRFGRRSARLIDQEMVRVSLSELRRMGLFNPVAGLPISSVAGVELTGREKTQYARLLLGAPLQEDRNVPTPDKIVLRLEISPQPFGGHRVWFKCPRPKCGRRCSVVYRETCLGSRAFACRTCCRLRYLTQSIGEGYRYERRTDRLMRRLHGSDDGALLRPRGMHLRTYRRLVREAETFMRASADAPPWFPFLR
jgi:hypothetical protein